MNADAKMKPWSLLIAWDHDDNESGEFGWSGLAESYEDALRQAVEAMADADHHEFANDGERHSWILDALQLPVLHAEEGANIWAASDMLAALKAVLPHVSSEVEQRKTSGHDEYWAELEAAEKQIIEAIAKAECRDGAA